MKELIFKSGNTVAFVECYGCPDYVHGVRREVLDFRFDATSNTLGSVEELFTADECAELTIRETKIVNEQKIDEDGNPVFEEVPVLDEEDSPVLNEDGNPVFENVPVMVDVERTEEFVYHNYSIRAAIGKQIFTLATENGVEDVEQISVKMAQKTETEIQLANAQYQLANAITEEELETAYLEGVNSL